VTVHGGAQQPLGILVQRYSRSHLDSMMLDSLAVKMRCPR
jgi:hypothetical protein